MEPGWLGRNRKLVALAVVATLVVGGLVWVSLRPRLEEAPQFALPVAGEGNVTLDLAQARGRVVVLDLMAVNCAACRTLTKQVLQPLWLEHGDDPDFELWSIDVWAALPGQVGETEANLLALAAEEGAPWPHALDDGTVYASYNPAALPQLAVIDKEGRVTFHASAPDLPSLESVRRAVAAAQAGGAVAVGIPQSGLVGLALVAGAAAVLSPCSIGLLPAYFGMLLRNAPGRPGPMRGGLQTAAGVVLVYGAIALLLLPFGHVLLPLVPKLGIFMGALFILLGSAMLLGFDWGRLTSRLRRDRLVPDGGGRGYWLFGLGYALASFGCTGPIFLPLLFTSFAAGPAVGIITFGLYTAGIAVLLVLVALLAAVGADGPLRRIVRHSIWVSRAVAVLWVGAGAYLVWYDVRAFS